MDDPERGPIGPMFHPGRGADIRRMIDSMVAIRDEGKLPGSASLVLSQLLLNVAGVVGHTRAMELIDAHLRAAGIVPGGN